MSFLLKAMIGNPMKNMAGGAAEEEEKKKEEGDGKETPQSKGMTREEFEEYQRQLVEEKWFHGKISGPEAVLKLAPPEDGLFLVRESIRHPGDYVLCVSFQKEVIHYRVIYKDSKLTIDHVQYFYNLIDMIQGNLVNFLRSRGRSLINARQLLRFAL
ncbi:Megakaryocyte-associated tyrosine-protein kinase [Acipenser ruthenus]|uniref:Megakaryocyte-associated tyrosine-protein kinase n=1 Tax=Acipenser ruthenus TaxID=7906 RepID=A0A444V6F1_ACIRT|nr:Megakaryocyte-associated tyrosine-protein kinase [Acipenser ruthenus]